VYHVRQRASTPIFIRSLVRLDGAIKYAKFIDCASLQKSILFSPTVKLRLTVHMQ